MGFLITCVCRMQLRSVRLGSSQGEELLNARQDVGRVGVQPFLDEGAVVELLNAHAGEATTQGTNF